MFLWLVHLRDDPKTNRCRSSVFVMARNEADLKRILEERVPFQYVIIRRVTRKRREELFYLVGKPLVY